MRTPLEWGRTVGISELIWVRREAEYFCEGDWTGFLAGSPSGKSVPSAQVAQRPIARGRAGCRSTVEGLAVHLEVGRATIYPWADQRPEFRDILEALLAAQGSQLIWNGLKGEYNPTITKLLLTKHSYTDRQDITSGGKPLLVSADDE